MTMVTMMYDGTKFG